MTKAKTLADTVSTGGPLATPGEVNLPGGSQGSVPYQSAAGVTALLAPGTAGHVLTSGGAGANPTWAAAVTAPAGSTGQVQINNAGAFGAVASGTSGQVLTSAGAGAAPTWSTPSAGAMVYLSTTTATNATNVDITGFSSTYDTYILDCPNFYSNATIIPGLRFFDAGTLAINNYRVGGFLNNITNTKRTGYMSLTIDRNFNDSFAVPLRITIQRNPNSSGGYYCGMSWSLDFFDGGFVALLGSGIYEEIINLSGIRILDGYGGTANCLSGTFKLYGIAKS